MRSIKALFSQQLKNLYHLFQAILANVWYGFPSRKIKIIGVTGTDGKTTTVQMIAKILQKANIKVAVASTINFVIDGKEEKNLSHHTTESSFALQKFIRKAVNAGCEYVVVEVSSHGLDQHRVWGIDFQAAVITNVTREHLDYHKTMEKYRAAKKVLFKNVAKNKGNLVVNLDMERPEEFLDFAKNKVFGYTCHPELVSGSRFRIPPKDGHGKSGMTSDNVKIINAEEIELGISGSKFMLHDTCFMLHVPGLFNVENALAATCVALGEGIDLQVASEALSEIKGVAGRMEAVANDLGVNILVDFALTPNALEKLYSLLYGVKKEGSKIIAILGSCGDRDQGKRPLMGEIVSRYADVMILTNEEPYHEEPQRIIDDIFAGIKNKTEGENCWRILDRRQAIAKALSIAKAGDIICITGMGNFETMVVGDQKIPWNDRQVIEEELTKIQFGCIVSS
jgi:UDP-N-acetylmuramoyl-L-alanyl-D-glutamate--2,6-diaminopimelate ligase